jgi:RNA polymerase sigma factor (sigma-70 family)
LDDRESLYADLQPLISRLIHQYGDDNESRKDLSGEIYYGFCALLEAFDPDRGVPLRPYLIRQLKASIFSYSREGWRRRKREIEALPDALASLTELHDPSADWDLEIVKQQNLQSLPKLIAKLPKRQRQVVIWRYYDAVSFERIAESLGIQVTTARSLLRHGLNNLRRLAMTEQSGP